MRFVQPNQFSRRLSEAFDPLVEIFSPRRAYLRQAYRMSYDAVGKSRLNKKRSIAGGTGDTHLNESNLYSLRETCRDLCRNNALAEGLLETERDSILGSGPKIEARTGDDREDRIIEELWQKEMLDQPCDVTGRFNFNKFLSTLYFTYRRDGDACVIYLDDALQGVEGEQLGTPLGRQNAQTFRVVNGVAYSNQTNRVIGYYIGEPSEYGYIKSNSYRQYTPDQVAHIFSPRRFSQSRGQPALTSAIRYIDLLSGYIDAELVAAKINACFTMFITQEGGIETMPDPYTSGSSSTGYDSDTGIQLEKMEPGIIMRGRSGEGALGIGRTSPASTFDPFVNRMLMFIGRPLCIPLMLVTLDFSGATFMNARIAYQKAQEAWGREQSEVIIPFVSRTWRWKVSQWIARQEIKDRPESFLHEVFCRRWPYVDPSREAQADQLALESRTTSRTRICSRQGDDWADIEEELKNESKIIGPQEAAPKSGGQSNAA